MTEIPLFPLNVVLFPFSKLPLHIFEERYKKMINDCIENDTVFGINFFSGRKIFTTGCTALVDEVLDRSQSGEMNIITKGIQRFNIISYGLGNENFYLGKVDYIDDDSSEYDKTIMEKAVKIYNELVEIVYKGSVRKIDLNEMKWFDEKRSVSFSMAEKSGLSLAERQSLLELNTEDKRLEFMLKYFDDVMPKILEADKISAIIKGDGYIQQ